MDMDGVAACDLGIADYLPGSLLAPCRSEQKNEAAAFRAVVRGERPVEDLKMMGAWIGAQGSIGRPPPEFGVCAADVAEGIINLKGDADALSEWAGFILAASDSFRIRDEDADYWDRLIACIWDLALGGHLGFMEISVANAVRTRAS